MRRWIAQNGGSLILVLLGASLLGASFFCSDDAPYALRLLIFGSSLVTVGVVLPRLRNAEVGPATAARAPAAGVRGPAQGWKPGAGAVGEAWQTGE